MRGRELQKKWIREEAYNEYRETKDYDIDKLKKQADDDNAEIDAEWFGDGKWQINDELSDVEEEDWEIWVDWFPDN